MEITSLWFLILVILSFFLYYVINHKYRIWFLASLSCGFIASYNIYLLCYIIIYTLFNFLLGHWISSSKHKQVLFRIGIAVNILQLVILKYSSFLIDPILSLFRIDFQFQFISNIIVPLGVSYFTLQGVGYIFNVKMNWEQPERKFANFLLYFVFFPKFLSGPIERSNHFLSQLKKEQQFEEQNLRDGLRLILFGLFKKLVIANQLAPFVLNFYENVSIATGYSILMVILFQPLYLYFDFSGYTDIALGIAKAFGLKLSQNFNKPFLAENVTNFWKKFHISLSSWFNDYVFKQTSFKYRKLGIYASIWAMLLTWTLFGIWHGAGWTFMFLGMLQALVILYEFFTKRLRGVVFNRIPVLLRIWIGRMFTYLFYGVSLVFFFAPSLESVIQISSRLFVGGSYSLDGVRVETLIMALLFSAIMLSAEIVENDFQNASVIIKKKWFTPNIYGKLIRWSFYFFIMSLIIVFSNEVQEFIYFQF